MEKDGKTCFSARKNYLDQRTAFGASVCWSKYTTHVVPEAVVGNQWLTVFNKYSTAKGRYFQTLAFPSLIKIFHSYKNTFFVFYETTLSSRIMFVLFIYFNPFCCPAHGVFYFCPLSDVQTRWNGCEVYGGIKYRMPLLPVSAVKPQFRKSFNSKTVLHVHQVWCTWWFRMYIDTESKHVVFILLEET